LKPLATVTTSLRDAMHAAERHPLAAEPFMGGDFNMSLFTEIMLKAASGMKKMSLHSPIGEAKRPGGGVRGKALEPSQHEHLALPR
jgi:hypothetical protein